MSKSEKLTVSLKMAPDLHERITDYRQRNDLSSDSEAIRELIRLGLRGSILETYLAADALGVADPVEMNYIAPEFGRAYLNAISSELEEMFGDMNLLEMAGGVEELSSEEVEALYRFRGGDHTQEDINLIVSEIFPKITADDVDIEVKGVALNGD